MATVQEGFVTFVTLSRPVATVQGSFVTFVTLSRPVATVQGSFVTFVTCHALWRRFRGSFVTFVTHFPVSGKTNTIVSESSGRRREANVKAIAIWLISYKVAILVVRI